MQGGSGVIQDGGCDAVSSVTLTTKAGAAILTPTPPVNRYDEMSDRKTRRSDRKPNYDGNAFENRTGSAWSDGRHFDTPNRKCLPRRRHFAPSGAEASDLTEKKKQTVFEPRWSLFYCLLSQPKVSFQGRFGAGGGAGAAGGANGFCANVCRSGPTAGSDVCKLRRKRGRKCVGRFDHVTSCSPLAAIVRWFRRCHSRLSALCDARASARPTAPHRQRRHRLIARPTAAP